MSWTNLKKPVLLILSLILLTTTSIGQSGNIVTITVNSTEYDNPSLTGLKEYLKANSKVKGLKSTFNNSVATLSFTYSDAADDLWDVIPEDKKKAFKLTFIDNKTIKLQVIKAPQTSLATNKPDTKNCGCDYFPLCNYDVTKSFNGKIYKGFRKADESIEYFNCDSGNVTRIRTLKVPTVAGDGYGYYDTYKFVNESTTILKTNLAIGATWLNTEKKGLYEEYSLLKKGISLVHNNVSYPDLIVLRVTSKIQLSYWEYILYKNEDGPIYFYRDGYGYGRVVDYYYAKDAGLIKTEDVTNDLSQNAPKPKPSEEDLKAIYNIYSGTWINSDDRLHYPDYYKIDENGIFRFKKNPTTSKESPCKSELTGKAFHGYALEITSCTSNETTSIDKKNGKLYIGGIEYKRFYER